MAWGQLSTVMPDPFINAFVNEAEEPTPGDLANALGAALSLWDKLLADMANDSHIDLREWHSYSRKAGWSMRVKQGQRTILCLSPSRDVFRASFALGAKALQAAKHNGLPARVLKIINEAKRYADGTAIRIEVKKPTDLLIVKKLAAAKLEN